MDSSNSTAAIKVSATQRAFIDGLRDLADMLERTPAAIPINTPFSGFLGVYGDDWDTPLEQMTALARATGGRWEKSTEFDDFRLIRHFGPHKITLFTSRENVCERVVTGTRMAMIPDPDFVATAPLVEVEQEIVEWVCPPSIFAEAAA